MSSVNIMEGYQLLFLQNMSLRDHGISFKNLGFSLDGDVQPDGSDKKRVIDTVTMSRSYEKSDQLEKNRGCQRGGS